jgi:hypothetical protein
MWAIWTSLNNITHDRAGSDPHYSMQSIRDTLALLEILLMHAKILSGHGWRPPDEGCVKINTDVSIAFDARKGGAGAVARNPAGFIGGWSKPYPGITYPIIAEALALRDGVIFAKLRGYSRVVIEFDCLEIVGLWDSRAGSPCIAIEQFSKK